MAKADQRRRRGSRLEVDPVAPPAGWSSRGDGPTDPDLESVHAEVRRSLEQRFLRRAKVLAAVMLAALLGALLLAFSLWVELARTRERLTESGRAVEKAVAERFIAERALSERSLADRTPPAATGLQAGTSPEAGAPRAVPTDPTTDPTADPTVDPGASTAPAAAAAPADDRLILLMTVGTRHFADKQLRRLKQQCRLPLAVYRQRQGRCGWSQCFVVAAPASSAEALRSCGHGKGQVLRDRRDFVLP